MPASSIPSSRHHACSACGYDLGPAARRQRCPECGRTPAERRLLRRGRERTARRKVWMALGLGLLVAPAMVATNVVFTHLVYRVPRVDPAWPNWVQTGVYPVLDATNIEMFALWMFTVPLWLVLALRWAVLVACWMDARERGHSGTPTHRADGRWLLVEAIPLALFVAATLVIFGPSTWMCFTD